MIELVTLGEILIDMFPAEIGFRLGEVSAFHPKPGGAPANVAVAASRLGVKSAFIGKVGNDAFGDKLISTLASQGVETRGILKDPNFRTTLAFIAMPDEYSAEFIFYRNPGADLQIEKDELDKSLLIETRIFHSGSPSLVDDPARSAQFSAAAITRSSGGIISFDVNYRPSLWGNSKDALEQIWRMIHQTDILKVNEIEIELLTGSSDVETSTRQLLQAGPKLVVVTMGQHGSFFCTHLATGFIPAFKVKTVDSVGCGDAFIAGLLSRIIKAGQGADYQSEEFLKSAFRYASAVGAITALSKGVIPALPSAKQVDEFLIQNP